MSVFAKLGVWLSLNSTELTSGLEDATKNVKQFEANVKKSTKESAEAFKELKERATEFSLALVALGAGIMETFKYAKEIKETADAFDITVASLMGLQKAMDVAGKGGDAVTAMLQKLTMSAQGAKEGNDKLRQAFDQIGISGREVETLSVDKLFLRVAEQLSKTEDATLRNAKAFELLGKQAKATDWNSVIEDYKRVGKSTDEVANAVNSASEAFENMYQGAKTMVHYLLIALKPLADAINGIANAWKSIKAGGGASIDWGAGAGEGGMPGQTMEFAPTEIKVGEEAELPKSLKGGYSTPTKKETGIASRIAEQIANAKEVTKEYLRQAELEIEREKRLSKYVTLSKNDLELQQEIARVTDQTAKAIAQTERELEVAKQNKTQTRNQGLIDELEKRKVVLELEKDAEIATITEIVKARQKEQESFITGWKKAYTDYQQTAQTYSDVGKKSFQDVTNTMSSALTNFVMTGKMGFSDLIRSMISNLLQLQVQYMSMQLFTRGSTLLSSFMPSSSSSILSSLVSKTGGMADGGTTSAGKPTFVGEEGPE